MKGLGFWTTSEAEGYDCHACVPLGPKGLLKSASSGVGKNSDCSSARATRATRKERSNGTCTICSYWTDQLNNKKYIRYHLREIGMRGYLMYTFFEWARIGDVSVIIRGRHAPRML